MHRGNRCAGTVHAVARHTVTARTVRGVVAAVLLAAALPAVAASFTLRMLAGSSVDTATVTARDIAAIAAPPADLAVDVLPSIAADSLRRLRYEPSVHLAIVPVDAVQALVDAAARGDADATDVVRTLQVVMPLYVDEIHFIARADSPLGFVDEIRDARINFGERGTGPAVTVTTLYRLMFDAAPANASYLGTEDALVKLITDQSVDVVPVVGGQPAPLVAAMKPEARKFVKLLRVSNRHAATERAMATYPAAVVRARTYPNLLTDDVPTLGVRAVLVGNDHDSRPVREALARLARSLCRNLPALQKHGHPKWREVSGMLPDIGAGIPYHPATSKEINLCIADRVSGADGPVK
jgi:uncharacterized protein